MNAPTYEYKKINSRDFVVDELYQRNLDKHRVARMVKNYNPYLVNAVKVSFRDGKYFVFDGFHTVSMLKALHKGNDCMVECKVYYGLTWFDEAELFLAQNGESRTVQMNDKFKTRFNMGDTDVVHMVRECEKLGIRIDFTGCAGDFRIVAITSLFRIYTSMAEKDFVDMLKILIEAYGGSKDSLTSEMLKGLAKFYTTYKGEFVRSRLVKQLQSTSPVVIVREAKASYAPGDTKYARQILNLYNYKAHNRLEDKF